MDYNEIKQCELYKKCSGCQLQNMDYLRQLSFKQAKVVKLLGRFCHIDEIIGMENPLHYRNKVQTAFARQRGRIVSGVYQSARQCVVATDSCMLQDKTADKIACTVRKLCQDFKIEPFDTRSGKGFVCHTLIRKTQKTNEIMVVLVTVRGNFPSKNAFVNELLKLHPEITTVVWNINNTDKFLMQGEKSEILFGKGYITEELLGLKFRISPKSFFQVNYKQTEVLYGKAMEFANLTGKETLIDAYCGTGTIGLLMSKNAKQVYSVESNRDAVKDGIENAKLNNIENLRFFTADAGDFMTELAKEKAKIDVVVTDPPRSGCSPKFLKSLISLSPEKIVYVSCNPETLARDLYTLRNAEYKVKKIQPVDMFPFTDHVESVVLLER